ncbi:MAG TPA: hypothetical protein VJ111_06270 [Chitinophagaceae bacterium]|nr:hypothetical protein [Chitinophagaceae bacterium]
MKKTIICGLTGIALACTTTSNAFSQNPGSIAKIIVQPAIEKIISSPDLLSEKNNNVPALMREISIKAVRNFTKEYKNVSNVKWFQSAGGFVVYFNMDGIKTKVYYNNKGNYECEVRNYYEDRLPVEVRHLVRSNYYDFSIHSVTEISAKNKIAYVVKLESKTAWKAIKVVDNEIEVTQEYKKG